MVDMAATEMGSEEVTVVTVVDSVDMVVDRSMDEDSMDLDLVVKLAASSRSVSVMTEKLKITRLN